VEEVPTEAVAIEAVAIEAADPSAERIALYGQPLLRDR
jgi:hypothetical protein